MHPYFYIIYNSWFTIGQGCRNPGGKVARTTILCTVAPNIYGFLLCNLHHATFVALRICRWLLDFWEICVPLTLKLRNDFRSRKFNIGRNFDIRGAVHRNSRLKKSNEMQQYADIYLLLNYSTCFGSPSCPSSGVRKTLVAAPGTDHTIWGASFLKRDQRSRLRKLAPQIVWSVSENATRVLCTPDDGRDGRLKHVE